MHYWGKREARPPWLQRTGVSGSPRQDTARSSQCPKAQKVGKEVARRELGDAIKRSQIGMIFAAVVGENSLAAAGKEGKKANVLVVCP
nr:hypothetical protein Iba_chr02bCG17540 [Ipomoea batatas]